MMERRRALDGYLPDRVERSKIVVFPRDEIIDSLTAGTGDKVQASTTTAFTRLLRGAAEGTRVRCAGRADHPRRGAHVRHGRAVRRVQDLRAVRPAVRAGRRGLDALVPRGDERPAARRGHHRSRRDGVVHRGRDRVRDVGSPDDPVLHLLFDVRVPAGRRPDLGVRRPARPRLPDRRDRGPHDAHRGRACSTATGSRRCTRSAYPNCRAYDPALRVRSRGARARRHPAHVRPRARRLLLLPHALQRELRAAADAGGRRRRHRARHVPAAARRRASTTHRAQILASGPMVLQALEAQQLLAEQHDVAADVWSVPGWKQLRDDAVECERWNRLHPERPAAHAVRHRAARRRGRPDRRGHRLGARGPGLDRAVRAAAVRRARHRRLRLLRRALGRSAATSRSTPRTSRSRCSTAWPRPATSRPRRWPRRSAATRSAPTPRIRALR